MSYFLGEFEVRQKPDLSPVTQADLEVETAIREMIAVRYPDDGVIGEEHGIGSGDRVWVVDPAIDGTKNFADGVPIWATLLALQVDGRSVLGIASAPALGERYEATQGGGAVERAGAPSQPALARGRLHGLLERRRLARHPS